MKPLEWAPIQQGWYPREFGRGLMHSGSTLVNMEMAPTSQGGSLDWTLTSASERTSPADTLSLDFGLQNPEDFCCLSC